MPNILTETTRSNANGHRAEVRPPICVHSTEVRTSGAAVCNKADIAELPSSVIHNMNPDELANVIRAADVPLLGERVIAHLKYYDRRALQRLAFLARRTVRNQGY